jgi:anti-sigma B factor antagonist
MADGETVLRGETTAFEVLTDVRGDSVVFCVLGEMDLSNVQQLTDRFEMWPRGDTSKIVFDLTGLRYCDSSGIRALTNAAERCDELGVEMSVVGAHGVVQRLFEIADVADMLNVESS